MIEAQIQDEIAGSPQVQPGVYVEELTENVSSTSEMREGSYTGNVSATMTYNSSLIVPASLPETYTLKQEIIAILLTRCTTFQEAQKADGQIQETLSNARNFIARCNSANSWGERASPDDE